MRLFSIGSACVVLFGISGLAEGQGPVKQPPVDKPKMSNFVDFTGRIEASQRVEIRARVTGFLTKVAFKEGSTVKQGDLLFEVDSRLYQAQLDQAKAQLKQAEATLRHAKSLRDRALAAPGKGALPDSDLIQAESAYDEAVGKLEVSRAGVAIAEINMSFTKVTAPISGTIGRSLLDVGNIVTADTTPLATVISTDPLYVWFDLDERGFLRLLRRLKSEDRKVELAMLPVQIALSDEEGFPHQGKVDFAESSVDPNTGVIRIRAVVSNPKGLMRPGMFVRVRMTVPGNP